MVIANPPPCCPTRGRSVRQDCCDRPRLQDTIADTHRSGADAVEIGYVLIDLAKLWYPLEWCTMPLCRRSCALHVPGVGDPRVASIAVEHERLCSACRLCANHQDGE